jgi:hypothetical protein
MNFRKIKESEVNQLGTCTRNEITLDGGMTRKYRDRGLFRFWGALLSQGSFLFHKIAMVMLL